MPDLASESCSDEDCAGRRRRESYWARRTTGPALVDQGAGDEHPRARPEDISHTGRSAGARSPAVPGRRRPVHGAWIDHVMREDASAAEEARQDQHRVRSFTGTLREKIVRHNPEQERSSKYPTGPAPGWSSTSLPAPRITLTSNGLDQGGLAATVRSQNGHMFVAADHQAEVFQHSFISAHHGDVLQVQ